MTVSERRVFPAFRYHLVALGQAASAVLDNRSAVLSQRNTVWGNSDDGKPTYRMSILTGAEVPIGFPAFTQGSGFSRASWWSPEDIF